MRYYGGSNRYLFDFIVSRLNRDIILSNAVTAFLLITVAISLTAGIAVWPVVWELHYKTSSVGVVCCNILKAGYIITPVCFFISLLVMIFDRQEFSLPRILLLNLGIFWLAASVFMITQQSVLSIFPENSFMITLLWIVISFFAGYILAVIPVILVSLIVMIIYKILDMILSR